MLKEQRRHQTGVESIIQAIQAPSSPPILGPFIASYLNQIIAFAHTRGRDIGDGVVRRLVGDDIPSEKWKELLDQAHKVAYRILGNDIDAGEAVGKATVKVVRSKTEPDNLGGYFMQTVKNEALRIRERQKGRVVYSESGWDWSDEGEGDASEATIALEDELMLAGALEDLTETDRLILKMRYWDLMTFPAIGQALGMKPEAVRKRHERALEQLRGKLTVGAF